MDGSYKRLEGIIYNDPKKQKLVFFRIIVDDSFEPLVRTVHEGLSDRSVGIFTLVSISLRTIPFNSPRRMLYSFFQPYSFRLLNWPFYSHKCALRISTLLFPFSCLERGVTSWRALDVQLSQNTAAPVPTYHIINTYSINNQSMHKPMKDLFGFLLSFLVFIQQICLYV